MSTSNDTPQLDIDRIDECANEQSMVLTNALLSTAGVKNNDIFLSKKTTQQLVEVVLGTINNTAWKPLLIDNMVFHMPMSSIQHLVSTPLREKIEHYLTQDHHHSLDERMLHLQHSVQHTIAVMKDYKTNLKFKAAKQPVTAEQFKKFLGKLGEHVCSNSTMHMTIGDEPSGRTPKL